MDAKRRKELTEILRFRFEANAERHEGVAWETVRARLDANPKKLDAVDGMERTGGEPDVIGIDGKTGECLFVDCAAESPAGRRSLCYDRAGLESRKEHQPAGDAASLAKELGIELLTEERYRALQELGEFDLKTSSWLETPPGVRKLGGAIFGDRRYGRVFVYHNGADSYYAVRGFRGMLRA